MKTVLFTGYAPVHYACFRPIHERIERLAGARVFVSGGLRSRTDDGTWRYDPEAMYGPFGLPERCVLTVEEIRERDFDVLVCANTKKITPRSFGCSVEIFHGMSFRNRAIRRANDGNDRYFVLGPYMRRLLAAREMLPDGDPRAVPVGFPKTDRLLDGSLDRASVLHRLGLSGRRPVVLYAPTGARGNSLETFGEHVIRALRAGGDCDVLVKLHDHPKSAEDWRARLAPLEDEHVRIVRTPDVVECLFAADVLVSDASSVSNEYALLDRPMVFLDVPALIASHRGADSALDLETWGRKAGEVVQDARGAVRAVGAGLEHPERRSEVRRAIVEDLFYNPGRATGVATDRLREVLAA